MTKSTESENRKDRGAMFDKVYLNLPSKDLVETLTLETQKIIAKNIRQARLVFQKRTLPIPGESARLCRLPSGLNSLVEETLLKDISHKDRVILYPSPDARGNANFVRLQFIAAKEGLTLEHIYAADLLGKYWYRDQDNQRMEIYEVIEEQRRFEELRDAGKPIPDDIFNKTKPPTSPRRKK